MSKCLTGLDEKLRRTYLLLSPKNLIETVLWWTETFLDLNQAEAGVLCPCSNISRLLLLWILTSWLANNLRVMMN